MKYFTLRGSCLTTDVHAIHSRDDALDLREISGKQLVGFKDLVVSGPAPAPLLRAETYYRYQLMLRTPRMSSLSRKLASLLEGQALPDDVTLTVDIDPVDLS